MDGQRRLLRQEASHDDGASRSHGGESIDGGDHDSVSNPHQSQAENAQPNRDQIGGMVLHGADGMKSHVHRGVFLTLNAQHPLIQGDFYPF